jgi:hypothetical protein
MKRNMHTNTITKGKAAAMIMRLRQIQVIIKPNTSKNEK